MTWCSIIYHHPLLKSGVSWISFPWISLTSTSERCLWCPSTWGLNLNVSLARMDKLDFKFDKAWQLGSLDLVRRVPTHPKKRPSLSMWKTFSTFSSPDRVCQWMFTMTITICPPCWFLRCSGMKNGLGVPKWDWFKSLYRSAQYKWQRDDIIDFNAPILVALCVSLLILKLTESSQQDKHWSCYGLKALQICSEVPCSEIGEVSFSQQESLPTGGIPTPGRRRTKTWGGGGGLVWRRRWHLLPAWSFPLEGGKPPSRLVLPTGRRGPPSYLVLHTGRI